MKKFLTVLTVFAFASTLAVNAAESQLQNFVNKKIAPLTQKEKELNSKIEAQQKADAQRRAEMEKKQAQQRAELQKRQAEQKAALDAYNKQAKID